MLTAGKPSPHDDLLINVEAFRGAIIKGQWKLVKFALLPGKAELFDLKADPARKTTWPSSTLRWCVILKPAYRPMPSSRR
jgi:hypothetical protein